MIIRKILGASGWEVAENLALAIRPSRFTAVINNHEHQRYGPCLEITKVRLKSRKEFCGNHPDACVLGGVDHKRAFLEGADWVEFNDLLNDTLDRLSVSAEVFSRPLELQKPLFIRHGELRRIRYDSEYFPPPNPLGQTRWVHDDPDCYENHYGKINAPRSKFPEGTPGIYTALNYHEVG